MDHAVSDSSIHRIVRDTLSNLGANGQALVRSESPLEGPPGGYRFECGRLCAIWIPDRRVLVFFRAGGELLKIVSLSNCKSEQAA